MERRSIDQWLSDQQGVVAVWQLLADGHPYGAIRHACRGLRQVHDGVYLSGHAPLTDLQRWKAATITAPGTVLSGWSAAALFGQRQDRGATTVTRPGNGGPRQVTGRRDRLGALVIGWSSVLLPDLVERHGIPATSPARMLLDLIPQTTAERADRLVRDALRTRIVTATELRVQVARHPGRRGVVRLRALTDEYAPLPLGRTCSDAEALALALLAAAGVTRPLSNVVVEGHEADLVWPAWRLIVELDGPQFHEFATHDARKQARWENAGWLVRRLPTADVYERPHRLLAAATDPRAM